MTKVEFYTERLQAQIEQGCSPEVIKATRQLIARLAYRATKR